METIVKSIDNFLGLITHVNSTQIPLGGVTNCANLAQINKGKIQRIPGVISDLYVGVDASVQIPLAFTAKGLGTDGSDHIIAIFVATDVVRVVNITTGQVMTGPALAPPAFGAPWSYTFYLNKWMFAGGNNSYIFRIDSPSAYSAVTGVNNPPAVIEVNNPPAVIGVNNPPGGNLICSYLDRLYVADVPNDPNGLGVVYYSGILNTDFDYSTQLINVKEIPGKITALAVNSPSTDYSGIETNLIIAKNNAIWRIDGDPSIGTKDLVSSVIGFSSHNTLVNTDIGLIGYGNKGYTKSIFYLPVGSAGEPRDLGIQLKGALEDASFPALSHAVLHGGFYKLFFCKGSIPENKYELWLDITSAVMEESILWYGVHERGRFDASTTFGNTLYLFSHGNAYSHKCFKETDLNSAAFRNSSGDVMEAVLDMPINIEPYADEKVFQLLEFRFTKEANINGNNITYEPIAQDVSRGVREANLYDSKSLGVGRVILPFRAEGRTAMVAKNARVIIKHKLNQYFDIIGASIQYSVRSEGERIRGRE